MNQFGIVLLVSERSGGNLLRTLLSNHHQVVAPIAPHLISEFYHYRKYYGDLRVPRNKEKLVYDMISHANHPYHNWKLDYKQVDKSSEIKCCSVISAMDYVYKKKAIQEGKQHYCSKGIHSVNFIDQIRAEVPSIKFVHLVRDPRDHVASWMKRPTLLLTPYDIILKWKHEQEVFIDAIQSRKLDAISIKYEDLISNTKKTMISVLKYLGLPVDEMCFSTNTEKNKDVKWNPLWKNLSNPIMSENKNKYKKELSNEDISLIETIAKKEMLFFNYKPESKQKWQPNKHFTRDIVILREKKAKLINENPFLELKSKIEHIENIIEKRREEWKKANKEIFNEKQKTKNKINLKKRLKYLSIAFLGENMSDRLIKKIKKL